jgi:hypothetical protein
LSWQDGWPLFRDMATLPIEDLPSPDDSDFLQAEFYLEAGSGREPAFFAQLSRTVSRYVSEEDEEGVTVVMTWYWTKPPPELLEHEATVQGFGPGFRYPGKRSPAEFVQAVEQTGCVERLARAGPAVEGRFTAHAS